MKTIIPTTVLLFYDFPQVFIGRDKVDLSYICMVVSEDEYGPKYICTPISKLRTAKLLSSKIDLLEALIQPEVDEFFECIASESSSDLILVKQDYANCPVDYLPEKGLFFDEYDEVASKALELNSTVSYASLSVAEAETSPRIKTTKLSEFLILYQNAIKNLTKLIAKERKIKIISGESPFSTDVFGFSHGSFTIQLQSSYSGDLLGDNALLAEALQKLNELLSLTKKPEESIRFLQSLKGHTASSLIKLLEFMVKNSCPLKHQWASPNMEGSSVAVAELSHINELIVLCRQRKDLLSEKVILFGEFVIANSDMNTWKVIDENGECSSGGVHPDSTITMKGITIRERRYKLVCEETVEVVLGTSKEVKKLLLVELADLS